MVTRSCDGCLQSEDGQRPSRVSRQPQGGGGSGLWAGVAVGVTVLLGRPSWGRASSCFLISRSVCVWKASKPTKRSAFLVVCTHTHFAHTTRNKAGTPGGRRAKNPGVPGPFPSASFKKMSLSLVSAQWQKASADSRRLHPRLCVLCPDPGPGGATFPLFGLEGEALGVCPQT